jgi:hypothetical protein
LTAELELLPAESATDEPGLRLFLDRLEQQLEQVSETIGHLSYQKYRQRRAPEELEQWEQRKAALMRNPAYHEAVSRFLSRAGDPLLERRLQVWDRLFRSSRVSELPDVLRLKNRIANRIVEFPYRVGGEQVSLGRIRQVLRLEPDRSRRRAAWESAAPLSRELAPLTQELVNLRNDAARAEGYANFARMTLHFAGLDLGETAAMLRSLQEATEPAYRELLAEAQEQAGIGRVEPWDFKFLLEGDPGIPVSLLPGDRIEERLREWGGLHGLPLERLGISCHFMDIPFNGLCMPITPSDIRILGTVSDGLLYYKTMFHELGHAMHAANADPGAYVLRREPAVWNEGMAELLGYTVYDPEWLTHVGLTAEQVTALSRGKRRVWFAYLRERSALALFEYALYERPGRNLDRTLGEVEAQIMGVTPDATPRWAANAWFSAYPVYWQNYVLADVIASQVHRDLRRRFGRATWGSREAMQFVRANYWVPAARAEWAEKLTRGTGRPLAIADLVADLTA